MHNRRTLIVSTIYRSMHAEIIILKNNNSLANLIKTATLLVVPTIFPLSHFLLFLSCAPYEWYHYKLIAYLNIATIIVSFLLIANLFSSYFPFLTSCLIQEAAKYGSPERNQAWCHRQTQSSSQEYCIINHYN